MELVFHRLISPEPGKVKISFYWNNDHLEAYDSFNSARSTERPCATFKCEGQDVVVQPSTQTIMLFKDPRFGKFPAS